MITVWHNKDFLLLQLQRLQLQEFPDSIPLEQLTPVAIIDTDNLADAFELSQNEFKHDERVQILEESRSTSVGDILQKSNDCWWLDRSCFSRLHQALPHVALTNWCENEPGEPFEFFPTLDLPDWAAQELINLTRLPDYWHYLETYRWKDGQVRQLLRSYK